VIAEGVAFHCHAIASGRYQTAASYPIASGVIEGACRRESAGYLRSHLLRQASPGKIEVEEPMNITPEQIELAKTGQPVEIQADDTILVIIRADMLNDVRSLLPPELVTRLVDDSMQEYDAGDPLLDSYQ
jgi:hypothetical protein